MSIDAVNNELEKDLIRMPQGLRGFVVTLSEIHRRSNLAISYDDLVKLSKEELYRLLPKPFVEVENDLNKGEDEGEVIQNGDPSIYRGGRERDGEEVEERWRQNIAHAYDLQKSIGRAPLGLKRLVDRLLKPRIDWRSLLKQAFRVGFGRVVVESWKRPSRKGGSEIWNIYCHPVKERRIPRLKAVRHTHGLGFNRHLRLDIRRRVDPVSERGLCDKRRLSSEGRVLGR
ncbi:MAG: hypothetical protein QXT14_02900 [Candidatus Bathyarchaeia archaeon]